MSEAHSALEVAVALGRDFDAAFAAPASIGRARTEAVLVVRATPEISVALKLGELGGVHECPPVEPLPGGPPEQLGIAGLDGNLTVVVSLAASIGLGRAAAGRWLALCRDDRSVALAFDSIEGYHQVAAERIRPAAADGVAGLAELVDLDGRAVPLVSASALLASVHADSHSLANDITASR